VELGNTPTETLAYTNEKNVFVSLLSDAQTLLDSINAKLRTTHKSVNVVSAETLELCQPGLNHLFSSLSIPSRMLKQSAY